MSAYERAVLQPEPVLYRLQLVVGVAALVATRPCVLVTRLLRRHLGVALLFVRVREPLVEACFFKPGSASLVMVAQLLCRRAVALHLPLQVANFHSLAVTVPLAAACH
jgi:hypothetical protein